MTKSACHLPFLLLVACTGDTGPQGPPGGLDPDLPALDKAYAGLGGETELAALTSIHASGAGERLMTLEGYTPEDDAYPVSSFGFVTRHDVEHARLRVEYHRTIPLFGAEKDYAVILDGTRGAIDGVESVFGTPGGPIPSDRIAATLRQQRWLYPHLILRDIHAGALKATDMGVALRDGQLRHRIDVANVVAPISLYVDRETGEIVELETRENEYISGDVRVDVHYAGYQTWGGKLRFPSDVIIAVGDQPVHVETRQTIETNASFTDATFALPAGTYEHVAADAERGERNSQFHESFAGLGVPLDGLQTHVEAQQLGTGVWHVRGGSHNSLVVEQANGVVVIEAPLYEARAKALIAWIQQTIPGKQITHVVATHHHRDHAGALRTFVARGARIVIGAAAKPYFTRAFRAGRTIEPDELAATPKPAQIDTVAPGATLVLADAARPVRVVAIDSTHAADMVVAYVPSTKTVFVSDIYSPGLPPNPAGVAELKAGIAGLDVTTIAGGHGIVGPVPQ